MEISLTGWIVFLLQLPILHPKWVAYPNYDDFDNLCHHRRSTQQKLAYHRSFFQHLSSGPPIGGRLPNGKNGED